MVFRKGRSERSSILEPFVDFVDLERSDPSYAAGEGVRGLKSVGNRDLTYKLAFYGTYIDEDSDWASRGSEEKGENIRSEEKMYLSASDKDPKSIRIVDDMICI